MKKQDFLTKSLDSILPIRQVTEERLTIRRGHVIPHHDGLWRICGGWAGQQGVMAGDRRHIFSFLIPGDLLPESSPHYQVVALTDLEVMRLHDRANDDTQALIEAARGRLFAHVARLAACGAYERIAGLLLELYERMRGAGLATGRRFPFPVGQEQIGCMMGLSEVHVNRTLAKLRADGHLLTGPGWYALPDPDRLKRRIDAGPRAA